MRFAKSMDHRSTSHDAVGHGAADHVAADHIMGGACGCGVCAGGSSDPDVMGDAMAGVMMGMSQPRLSRRRFLQTGATAATVGGPLLAGPLLGGPWLGGASLGGAILGAAPLAVLGPRAALAQATISPDEALARMMAGNKRFVQKRLTSFDEDLTILKQKTAEKQEPFAAVLSCADSRVPVELVFDQSIGHVFVTRVAGNVATPEIIASLEYGAAVLGTRVILVLGHSNCGAVKASMEGKEVPGQISALYAPIRPAIDTVGMDAKKGNGAADATGDAGLTAAIRANAEIQAHLLATASPVLVGLIKAEKLQVAAAYYDLASGKVELLS